MQFHQYNFAQNDSRLLKYFFWAFVFFYMSLLLIKPSIGPGDEFAFLPTLQSGKFFPMYTADFIYYNHAESGRLSPLGGQEYNLFALISNTAQSYFVFNALVFIIFVLIFLRILNEFSPNRKLNYLVTLLLLFVPGFTVAFFKILYSEKSVLLYFSIFLLSFILFHKKQRWIYFFLVLLSANIVIYYKETAFLAIGAFGVSHLLLSWKKIDGKSKFLDSALIISAAIYLAIYLIRILPRIISPTGHTIYNPILVFIKNFLNYGFFSDPILIFIFVPVVLWRLYKVLIKRFEAHPILDPMLMAGFTYLAAYFVLNLYSPYYFLPIYVFAIPPVIYFLSNTKLNIFWKTSFAGTAFILLVNSIPLGIHYLTHYKYLPINFNKAIDFLVEDVNKNYSGKRLNIFFDGIDRGTGRGVYFVAGEYLKFKGLSIRKFDFKSNMEAADPTPFVGRGSPFDKIEDIKAVDPTNSYKLPHFPFTVFQPGPLSEIKKGDYLVVVPQSVKGYDKTYIENLKNDYNLVFYTESPFAFPSIHLKMVVKHYLSSKLSAEQKVGGLMVTENFLNWPDYYVFVRK